MSKEVIQIFWPDHINNKNNGWLIGWNYDNVICIASLLEDKNYSISEKNNSGKPSSNTNNKSSFKNKLLEKIHLINKKDFTVKYWGSKLSIVGFYSNENDQSIYDLHETVFVKDQNNPKIIQYKTSKNVPFSQFIFFTQPKYNYLYIDEIELEESKKNIYSSMEDNESFKVTLNQINTSKLVDSLVNEDNLTSEKLMAYLSRSTYMYRITWYIFHVFIFIVSMLSPIIHSTKKLLRFPFPIIGSLQDISLLASTIEKRCSTLLHLSHQWKELNSIERKWKRDIEIQKSWINFSNTVLCMLIDWILGLIIMIILWNIMNNNPCITLTIAPHITTLWGYNRLKLGIEWVKEGRPGGIKLSIPLSNALGSLFLFYIEKWAIIVLQFSHFSPYILWTTNFVASLGLSASIALLHDFMYFFNMHIYWLYSGMTRLYNVQLKFVFSLWLLFRGKKKNVLKNRIDSCRYDVDQLLFGTLLFTAFILLLPTMLMYYIYFVTVMLLVLVLRAVFELLINILFNFPVYAFILNITGCLNGGSYIETMEFKNEYSKSVYFRLKSKSLKMHFIFSGLKGSTKSIISKFEIKKLLNNIIFGERWKNKSLFERNK